jgi:excisionase family DNA binding protein
MNDGDNAMAQTIEADWPAVRDAMRLLGVSNVYVLKLIRQQRIRAARTRLGWLLDPSSLAAFEAERAARLRKRSA